MNRKIRLYQGYGSSVYIDLENLICFTKYNLDNVGKNGYFIETRTFNGCGGQQIQFYNEERRETAYKKLLDSFKEYVPEDKDIVTLEKGDGKIFRLKVKDCVIYNIRHKPELVYFVDNRGITLIFKDIEQKEDQFEEIICKVKDNDLDTLLYEVPATLKNTYTTNIDPYENVLLQLNDNLIQVYRKVDIRNYYELNYKIDGPRMLQLELVNGYVELAFDTEELRELALKNLNDRIIPLRDNICKEQQEESLDKCVVPDNDDVQTKKTFTDTEKVKKIIAALTELDVKYDYTQNKDNSIEITIFIPRIDIDMKGLY